MNTQRPMHENSFQTHDKVTLFYRHFPATETSRGALILVHRGHEHSGRMAHLVDELTLPDFDFFAYDARGHGKSDGMRGDAPNVACLARDLQSFTEHIVNTHNAKVEEMAVIAQSVGAVVASTWAHDYAPRIRALVLASPAFKVKLYVPFARQGLCLQRKIRGNFFINSYVKAKFLTHDVARQESFNADKLITRAISVDVLLDLYKTGERIVEDAQGIIIPTQLFISGADWVVHHKPQHDFFANLGTPIKEKYVLDGFFHDTLGEEKRAIPIEHMRAFILKRFSEVLHRPDLNDADKKGATFTEAAKLAKSLCPFSPKGLYWAATRANLKLGGFLSAGVKLGHETGFDSGSTLDYVYRNKAAGAGFVGRLIDRQYLDAIGWRGIRQRKIHLEELLQQAMKQITAEQKPLRIMDIAAGHGRYVLDALANGATKPESILLRDFSDINVRDGEKLIAARGLENVAKFVKGDAFDQASLAAVSPKVSIGIVSGLYELFPSNDLIRSSLAGLFAAIENDGYLIYTGQPWHPQLEFIARALTSHKTSQEAGNAWVMRRRSQAEIDQLVAEAGFTKITQRIDAWGIFTVSLARRVS